MLSTLSSSWKTCIGYYHSYGITPKYIIFIEQPLLVNGFKLVTCTAKGKPLKDCFEWHPHEQASCTHYDRLTVNVSVLKQTRFYVICKKTGDTVHKYYAKAFFYFHTINSYEEDDHVVIDLMAYDNSSIIDKWDLNKMRNDIYDEENQAVPTRFVMPLNLVGAKPDTNLVTLSYSKAKAVMQSHHHVWLTPEVIGPAGFELPTINTRHHNGNKYRYCYGSGVFEKGNFANSVWEQAKH